MRVNVGRKNGENCCFDAVDLFEVREKTVKKQLTSYIGAGDIY